MTMVNFQSMRQTLSLLEMTMPCCSALSCRPYTVGSFPPGFELMSSACPHPALPQSGFFHALFCTVVYCRVCPVRPFCIFRYFGVSSRESPVLLHILIVYHLNPDTVLNAFVPWTNNPAPGLPGSAPMCSLVSFSSLMCGSVLPEVCVSFIGI